MPNYTLFSFKRSSLTHHNIFTVFRAWALMTEVALCGHCSSSGTDWKRLWGSGENSCHSLFCYFIPDPNTLLLLPSHVLGHQTGLKYFSVANQKLGLYPSTTKSSLSSGGIPSFSNAATVLNLWHLNEFHPALYLPKPHWMIWHWHRSSYIS